MSTLPKRTVDNSVERYGGRSTTVCGRLFVLQDHPRDRRAALGVTHFDVEHMVHVGNLGYGNLDTIAPRHVDERLPEPPDEVGMLALELFGIGRRIHKIFGD